jgi:hypothetical protein
MNRHDHRSVLRVSVRNSAINFFPGYVSSTVKRVFLHSVKVLMGDMGTQSIQNPHHALRVLPAVLVEGTSHPLPF